MGKNDCQHLRNRPGWYFLLLNYLLLLTVIFFLPAFSLDGYSLVRHTTSQLGAQQTPYAWIMNGVFLLMATASVAACWSRLQHFYFQKIVLLLFSLSLILAAIFRHAPIDPVLPYQAWEDQLHSIYASSTGFTFTLFAISMIWVEPRCSGKILAIFLAILSILLSILIFHLDAYRGIWQRLMLLLAFAWLLIISQKKTAV